MPDAKYQSPGPTRAEIDAAPGGVVLEFGTDWCGFCKAAQPLILEALSKFPAITHIKVEDGPGRKLGRSFRIKLWPSLIILKDGLEIARVVRPQATDDIEEALRLI